MQQLQDLVNDLFIWPLNFENFKVCTRLKRAEQTYGMKFKQLKGSIQTYEMKFKQLKMDKWISLQAEIYDERNTPNNGDEDFADSLALLTKNFGKVLKENEAAR